ncbi:unnamed protein product, partial [Onchocerca flexuosa]|uniref:EGF-like domain protein n=1 Tax=Onchocerca flexuosa TaxID=387005 RepID=A0A183HF34_9BILA
CRCAAGFTGLQCQQICSEGRFGPGCREKCRCANQAHCDPITGACRCSLGYIGAICEQPCPDGKYGPNCTLDCECYGNAKCDPVQGCCDCPPGRYGTRCQYELILKVERKTLPFGNEFWESIPNRLIIVLKIRKKFLACPAGFYGWYCSQSCDCQNGATCDPDNGQCRCLSGYFGKQCEQSCANNTYGPHCQLNCDCGKFQCDPETGKCDCPLGLHGPKCKQDSSKKTVAENIILISTRQEELFNLFCVSLCLHCNANAINSITFRFSMIIPKSDLSFVACRPGRYGKNCEYRCECYNGAICDRVTGQCTCAPGYLGATCQHEQFDIESVAKRGDLPEYDFRRKR